MVRKPAIHGHYKAEEEKAWYKKEIAEMVFESSVILYGYKANVEVVMWAELFESSVIL